MDGCFMRRGDVVPQYIDAVVATIKTKHLIQFVDCRLVDFSPKCNIDNTMVVGINLGTTYSCVGG